MNAWGWLENVALFVATTIAAAILGSILLCAVVFWPAWLDLGNWAGDAKFGVEALVAATVISMPMIGIGLLLFGLPADYALRRLRLQSGFAYMAAGLGGGFLLSLVFNAKGDAPWGSAFVTCMGYGLITATLFWLIVRRGRPGESVSQSS